MFLLESKPRSTISACQRRAQVLILLDVEFHFSPGPHGSIFLPRSQSTTSSFKRTFQKKNHQCFPLRLNHDRPKTPEMLSIVTDNGFQIQSSPNQLD